MLNHVAEGVLVHQSAFLQSNTVVVEGRQGVLLIDPGVTASEMACLVADLHALGQPVVAGFSTHPHWDHLLWHATLGDVPRYGTGRCATTVRDRLSGPDAAARVAAVLPPDIADQIPLELLGRITGLSAETAEVPWDGPGIQIIEHRGHAPGHAALVIEERGVLVAGDMLSDVLIPMLDLSGPGDPVEDYLAGLRLIEGGAGEVEVVIPGHGSVGRGGQLLARLDQDRAYVRSLGDPDASPDPRIGPAARFGKEWLPAVHERQRRG